LPNSSFASNAGPPFQTISNCASCSKDTFFDGEGVSHRVKLSPEIRAIKEHIFRKAAISIIESLSSSVHMRDSGEEKVVAQRGASLKKELTYIYAPMHHMRACGTGLTN
jgi:hypothetical protein